MGKSILVMDTPECCDYCPAGRISGMAGQVECRARETIHVNPNGRTVPDWCPLQDAPEKKGKNPYHNEHESGYVEGWNDCLDHIELTM